MYIIAVIDKCPRNNTILKEDNRICRKPCTKNSDCAGHRKKCLCDDACGLSCYNPSNIFSYYLIEFVADQWS